MQVRALFATAFVQATVDDAALLAELRQTVLPRGTRISITMNFCL